MHRHSKYIDETAIMFGNLNDKNDNNNNNGDDERVERKCKSHLIQSNDIFVIILLIPN